MRISESPTQDRYGSASDLSPRQRQDQEDAAVTNVGTGERWASVLGGLALAAYGLKRRSLSGATLALGGSALVVRGITGYCQCYGLLGIDTANGTAGRQTVTVDRAITIDKPAAELYRFWRQFENLPRFMAHLQAVCSTGPRQSHWEARAPLGTAVEWEAEVTEIRDDEYIAWRSLPGSQIPNHGWVRFQPAPQGRGTEVHVHLVYEPPAGKVGARVVQLFGEEPAQQLAEDLQRFKCLMETGEIPTIDGQASVWVDTSRQQLPSQPYLSPGAAVRPDADATNTRQSSPVSEASTWVSQPEER